MRFFCILRQCSCRTKIGKGVLKAILGITEVSQPGIEDIDFGSLVRNHSDWCKNTEHILHILGLDRCAGETA
jgi:hypothetical protein